MASQCHTAVLCGRPPHDTTIQINYPCYQLFTRCQRVAAAAVQPWRSKDHPGQSLLPMPLSLISTVEHRYFHVVLKLMNSDQFHSIRNHNIVEVLRLLSRLQRVCRHSVTVHVVSIVVKLSSRRIVDGLLITVGHSIER